MSPKKFDVSDPVVPCALSVDFKKLVVQYAEALRAAAPSVGDHGLSEADFWRSGLFHSSIERLRGQQAASTKKKYAFFAWALDRLKAAGEITDHKFTGARDRHDFHVFMPDGKVCVFEAKGCLDGNNTQIFSAPT